LLILNFLRSKLALSLKLFLSAKIISPENQINIFSCLLMSFFFINQNKSGTE